MKNTEKFNKIYKDKLWGHGSGEGSLAENTIAYRDFLQGFIERKNISSILDFGCGDWQFSKYINWGDRAYLGVDVVSSVIANNNRNFKTKRIKFQKIQEGYKLPPADLLIVKDVLQHWTNGDTIKFLTQLYKFKYILITNDNYPAHNTNKELDENYGFFRPIDLRTYPFNLPAKVALKWHTDAKLPNWLLNKETLLLNRWMILVYILKLPINIISNKLVYKN